MHGLLRHKAGIVAKCAEGDCYSVGAELGIPEDGPAQSGQKWKVTRLPLSPRRVKTCDGPVVFASSRPKKTATPKAEPVRFLQASQWQRDILTGSVSTEALRVPQAQEAIRFAIAPPFASAS
jgi:hypothetical protein